MYAHTYRDSTRVSTHNIDSQSMSFQSLVDNHQANVTRMSFAGSEGVMNDFREVSRNRCP